MVSLLSSVNSTKGVVESPVSRPSDSKVAPAQVIVVLGVIASPTFVPAGTKKLSLPPYPKVSPLLTPAVVGETSRVNISLNVQKPPVEKYWIPPVRVPLIPS